MKKNNLKFYFLSSYCYWIVTSFHGNKDIYFDSESKTWQFWLGRLHVKISNTHSRRCSEFRAFLKQLYESKSSDIVRNYLDAVYEKACKDVLLFSKESAKSLVYSKITDILPIDEQMKSDIKSQIDQILINKHFKLRNTLSESLRNIYRLFDIFSIEGENLIKGCVSDNYSSSNKKSESTIIRRDDLEKMLSQLNEEKTLSRGRIDYFRFFAIFAYYTGLRAGEIFDFKTKELLNLDILASKTKISDKKDGIRSFSGELTATFLKNSKKYGDLQQLILTVNHYIENDLQCLNREYFFQLKNAETKEMNVDVYSQYRYHLKPIKNSWLNKMLRNIHGFRRGYATDIYAETGNIATVQQLLNHADPETTSRYIAKYVAQEKARDCLKNFLLAN